MPNDNVTPVFDQVMSEQMQGHEKRKTIIEKIEKIIDRPLISYCTSFNYPVMIEDGDATLLEGLLQKMDLSRGLALFINSPGGDGLAAERIINICRNYSKTGEFIALVPGKAKSAATMICFGASKIYMSPTSELGPIDPQIVIKKENKKDIFAVCNIVESYKELFKKATKEKGNLQPYLQQLSNYDAREIKEFEAVIEFAHDVAIRALESGMMTGQSKMQIKKDIKIFLTPEVTKTHGRAIFHNEAIKCKLNIELMDLKSDLWANLYELYFRSENFTNSMVSKCFETIRHSFGLAYHKNDDSSN